MSQFLNIDLGDGNFSDRISRLAPKKSDSLNKRIHNHKITNTDEKQFTGFIRTNTNDQ